MSFCTHSYSTGRNVIRDEVFLIESPGCQINSVTFDAVLPTHYSTGQLKEEEKPRSECVETLETHRVKGRSESFSY